MKKIIGLPLLLLTNFAILVHAVIPHHHHDKIAISICNLLSINDALDHEHDHRGHGLGKNNLSNGFYLYLSQDNQDYLSSVDTNLDYSPVFIITPAFEIEIKNYGGSPFRQKPYLFSSYSHYITHFLGLRAPPYC